MLQYTLQQTTLQKGAAGGIRNTKTKKQSTPELQQQKSAELSRQPGAVEHHIANAKHRHPRALNGW